MYSHQSTKQLNMWQPALKEGGCLPLHRISPVNHRRSTVRGHTQFAPSRRPPCCRCMQKFRTVTPDVRYTSGRRRRGCCPGNPRKFPSSSATPRNSPGGTAAHLRGGNTSTVAAIQDTSSNPDRTDSWTATGWCLEYG